MHAALTAAGARDFRQRYANTFGFYTTESGKRLLVRFTNDIGTNYASFTDSDGETYKVKPDKNVLFEFLQVERGWFNSVNTTYYLNRIPARQWQRGICAANTQIAKMEKNSFKNTTVDFPVLEDIYNKPINYLQAVKAYTSGERQTAALSKHFGISADGIIYLYQEPVAVLNKKSMVVTVNNANFFTEVNDVVRRLDIGWSVL